MHSTHIILVNLAEDYDPEKSIEEMKEIAYWIANEETERFYGSVFDSRHLLEEGEDDDFPVPIVLSKENWSLFEDYLLSVDKAQKLYAKALMERVRANTGTSDLCKLLNDTFLSHDRSCPMDEIEKNHWEWDECADTPWEINIVADLMHGVYNFDSQFYDTHRGTSLVPFLTQLKKSPDDWALVAFNCHF